MSLIPVYTAKLRGLARGRHAVVAVVCANFE